MTQSNCSKRNCGPLDELSHDMERVFDSLLGRTVGSVLRPGNEGTFVPALDVAESEAGFVVTVDLPGVNPDEVNLEMHEGKLIISGARPRSSTDLKLHRVERRHGDFRRVISLPKDVDTEQIEAKYEFGVLQVSLPKVAKAQPKKIQIRST